MHSVCDNCGEKFYMGDHRSCPSCTEKARLAGDGGPLAGILEALQELEGIQLDERVITSTIDIATNVLGQIVMEADCYYIDAEEERPDPCHCPKCLARDALERIAGWRYRCSDPARLKWRPHERVLVDAWKSKVGDLDLALILREKGKKPSPRDWFVATSIVRWMATNVGRCMFQEAMRLADKEIKDAREEDRNVPGGGSGVSEEPPGK